MAMVKTRDVLTLGQRLFFDSSFKDLETRYVYKRDLEFIERL